MLERFFRILETFDSRESRRTLTEIASRAKLPMSTAHRMVHDMLALGALRRGADGTLRIGLRIWELGYRGSDLQRLRETALPFMLDVQAVVQQHTNLAIRDGRHVVYLERLSAPRSASMIAFTATRLELEQASSGLVLLAFSAEADRGDDGALGERLRIVRRDGYCVAPGLTIASSTGIAVPILDRGRTALAALSVIVPRDAVDAEATIVPTLLVAARGISRALLARGPQAP